MLTVIFVNLCINVNEDVNENENMKQQLTANYQQLLIREISYIRVPLISEHRLNG